MDKKNTTQILVCVAWPYANGEQHIGHIAGAYLPPDIFSRYQRMLGREVLMVSGSDTHGTPITVRAEEEKITPADVVAKYHQSFVDSYQKLGFTFDIFTHTDTENHWKTVQELFLKHSERGYIFRAIQKQLFDQSVGKFLPDRYVEGTCPHCGAADARGDQCDKCGKTYDAIELKNPKSKITGSTSLEVRETEHFFIDLSKLNEDLIKWLGEDKDHWRKHVINFAKAQAEKRELRGRPITRDLDWGISIPVKGFEGKCIYVWYEAVIGYLSSVRELSLITKKPDMWKKWWLKDHKSSKDVRSYYFIGKDNIDFHAILWPAMLLAHGELNLPYDVPANEYLNSYGRKFSKSRGNVISIPYVLSKYQPDAWRYALTALAPETSDVDFTWDDFLERVNNELVANWGNLANRMLGFAYKRYEGKVPAPQKPLDQIDKDLLAEVKNGFSTIGELYEAVKLKAASEELRKLCQRVNQYLNDKAPWTMIKTDAAGASTSVFVALQCIDWLKTMWAPILPHSCQLLHEYLGYDGQLFGRQFTETHEDARGSHMILRYDHSSAIGTWMPSDLKAGHPLREAKALFIKLDEKILEEETLPK